MPYVSKTKKTRRRYHKGKKRYAKRRMLSFTKAPIPNKFATKLRYADQVNMDPGAAGVAAVLVLSANGLYDPNISQTGHQPRGFDQWMTMFDHYCVIGAKLTCRFISYSNTEPIIVGINLKDSETTYADKVDYEEGRNCRTQLINSNANEDHRQLSLTFSTKKFLGITHPLSSSVARGSATANPTEGAYFHVWGAPFGTGDVGPFKIQYWIDYLVVFHEPKQPAMS